ncbi:MAG: complex I subunit 4 family protein, partial [Anaerolineales bacterium]
LICSVWVYWAYDRTAAGFQFTEEFALVPSLGITYLFAVDGISTLMCLLTSIIIFAGVFASWTVKERSQEFYALLLVLVTGVYGVFVSLDLFLFFLFYEIAVLPMYLLIGIWGSTGEVRPQGTFAWAFRETGVGTKEYAAMKLTLYLLFGSAFILVGLFVLYFAAGAGSFSLLALSEATFSPATQRWVLLLLYVGFGLLAGIWPLHTWSPDGHASAPTAVSMLHAGVLMKLGAYGVVRVAMTLLPEATQDWAPLVGTVAVINVVYGAFSAMAQTDLKYVVAYSSVSHMGLVMLGAATLTEAGLNGAVSQMFAHGIMTGLFFALVGLIYEKSHTREIGRMGGFGRRMPGIAACFTLGGLSSLGLPGLAGFIAEILTFLGAWQSAFRWWLFPAVLGTLLTAIYVLRVAKRIFWGPLAPGTHG